MEKDKFLFVVSGAAGTGKDSVVKALREAHPEIEKIRVCHHPQPPAPGEQEGVDYYYRTQEQFRHLIDTDQVVEYNFYNGNYYGTLREEVDKRLEARQTGGSGHRRARCCQHPPDVPGCYHGVPAAAVGGRTGTPPAWPRNRDRRKHPRASGHGPERAGRAG